MIFLRIDKNFSYDDTTELLVGKNCCYDYTTGLLVD